MSQFYIDGNSVSGASVNTLSAEGGADTPPDANNNFDFSGTADGAITFATPADGEMTAAVNVDDGTVSVNATNELEAILQIQVTELSTVVTTTNPIPTDNSIPQNDEGTEIMTLAFTPKSATSRLFILASVWGSTPTSGTTVLSLFQDAGVDAIAATTGSNLSGAHNDNLTHTVISGSTTARTYSLRGGTSAGGLPWQINGTGAGASLFGGVASSTLTVIEMGVTP